VRTTVSQTGGKTAARNHTIPEKKKEKKTVYNQHRARAEKRLQKERANGLQGGGDKERRIRNKVTEIKGEGRSKRKFFDASTTAQKKKDGKNHRVGVGKPTIG